MYLVTSRCLSLLEKCKSMRQVKQAHGNSITCGLGHNPFTLSRILALCADPFHGNLAHACNIFNRIHHPTICIYNTMIKAFLLRSEITQTLLVYSTMLHSGTYPDNYTLPYLLKASSSSQTCYLGESIHGHCLKLGFMSDLFVGNSLITMYFTFNKIIAARYLFDEMPSLTVVSWTLMITGLSKVGDVQSARLFFDMAPLKDRAMWGAVISANVQNCVFVEAFNLFSLMRLTGIEPDEAIFVSILCACANLGLLETGMWLHCYIDRLSLPWSLPLTTSLIDMYAKCGNFGYAKKLFDKMPQRDAICYTVMISAMAIHGDGKGAINLFYKMEELGIRPNDVTFIAVLSACSYSGLVSDGLKILDKMCNTYNIEPKSEHYGCIVDLLAASEHLEEAKEIILRIPEQSFPSEKVVAWKTLLKACCDCENLALAEAAAEKVLQQEGPSGDEDGVFILLANLYAVSGKYDDAERLRKVMRNKRVDKEPGSSSIFI